MTLAPEALQAVLADGLQSDADSTETDKPLARRVGEWLEANQSGSEIVELYTWGLNVEFVLRNGEYWAIECLSPSAFRMYPGFVRGDTVTWPNIWVRDDLSLEELVKNINEVAFRTAKEEFQNA